MDNELHGESLMIIEDEFITISEEMFKEIFGD